MPLLGAHTSIAGGLERALERGRAAGCEVVQIFTGSSRQWRSPRIGPREIEAFREAQKRTAVQPIAIHTHYLINLASTRPEVFERSLDALANELERTGLLGIPYVVLHPGAHLGSGERAGLRRVSGALARFVRDPRFARHPFVLETPKGVDEDGRDWDERNLAHLRRLAKTLETS